MKLTTTLGLTALLTAVGSLTGAPRVHAQPAPPQAEPAPSAPAQGAPAAKCPPNDKHCKAAPAAPNASSAPKAPPDNATAAPAAPSAPAAPPPPPQGTIPPAAAPPAAIRAPAAPGAIPAPAAPPISTPPAPPPGATAAPAAPAHSPAQPTYLPVAPPPPRYAVATERQVRSEQNWWDRHDRRFGQHTEVSGVVWDDIAVVGATASFRFRPGLGWFALDAGLGFFGGQDWARRVRFEVPVLVDANFFVNPREPVQFFFTVGAGVSFAWSQQIRWGGNVDGSAEVIDSNRYVHVGMRAGFGVEFKVSRLLSLNAALRVFARENVADGEAEFVERTENGTPTGRTTNFSAGVLPSIGTTIYF
jgi:hypothetical protein